MIPAVIWIPFFHFHVWKVFSPSEKRLASWMGLGIVVETDGSHAGINFVSSTILEEVPRKYTLAKVTKNLLFV